MPYRGAPTTDANDAIRLLIGDTSTSTGGEIFADGEIDYFAALKPNAYLSAVVAIESIMGSTRGDDLSQSLSSKKVGDLNEQYRSGAAQGSYLTLREKIRHLRAEGSRGAKPFAGGISDSAKRTTERDTDWTERMQVGKFDYPGEGSTEFA